MKKWVIHFKDKPGNGRRGDLKKIQSFKVERWCGATPETEHTLYCFSDASETAYGCCIYITSPTTRHLVYAKAKVAPVKRQTLARLELQAAFMASSALDMVCNHVRTPICEVHCWTDSLTTFHWLNKPPHHWKTWVANRVFNVKNNSFELTRIFRIYLLTQ